VSFLDSNGIQYAIPLAWIVFPPAPALADPTSWPGWSGSAAAQKSNITNWVGTLGTEGLLALGAAPPNPPAFTVTAVTPGSTGNDISLTVNAVYTNNTMDVTVTVLQTYPGLTWTGTGPNLIQTVLGIATVTGTQPGLAVVGNNLTALPDPSAPASFSLSGGSYEFAPSTFGAGSLLPSNDPTNSDAGTITAAVSAVDSTAETFTLTLGWTKKGQGLTLSSIAAEFAYVVTITVPAGSTALPAAGTAIYLAGGTDADSLPATAATATVISG